MSGGHTKRAVNQMNAPKATACINSVRLMFIRRSDAALLEAGRDQRIAEREQHRDAEADDERRVDQPKEQEYLGLKLRHQFGLTRGAFEEPRTHDADADARPKRAQADHQSDADPGIRLDHRDELHLVHSFSFLLAGLT